MLEYRWQPPGGAIKMSPIRMSKIESAMRVVLEFNEAFNRHDTAGMMAVTGDECVFETTSPPPNGKVYSGKETITQFWREFFLNSPQAKKEIEEIFSLGNRCIMRWRYSWRSPAGKKGEVRGVEIVRVEENLICEMYSYTKGESGYG